MADSPKPPSWFLVVRRDGEVVCACGNEASASSFAKAYDEPTNPSRVVPVWEKDPNEALAASRVYIQKMDAILARLGAIEDSVREVDRFACRVGRVLQELSGDDQD